MRRFWRLFSGLLVLGLGGLSGIARAQAPAAAAPGLPAYFDEVLATLQSRLAQLTKPGTPFAQKAEQLRQAFVSPANHSSADVRDLAFSELLGTLQEAAPTLLSSDDQRYWSCLGAFSGQLAGAPTAHIGAWFARRGGKWLIASVFPGGPAARAGLVAGDEIVAVDGRELAPVASFQKIAAGGSAQVTYKRLPWSAKATVTVPVLVEGMQQALLHAMLQGQQTYRVQSKLVAYIALPLSSHARFREALVQAATAAQVKADALVLDLRGDYGGSGLTYLEPFVSPPSGRDLAVPQTVTPYTKPLVVLIDQGTRGGRERLAWLLKQAHRAVLVGQASGGAMHPVEAFEIVPQRYLLLVPVLPAAAAPHLAAGVNPDVPVAASAMYSAGHDSALDRALTTAAGL